MISFIDLIPRPSLRGADISDMPKGKNLRWHNLDGAKCDYDMIKNRTWVQKGLILYEGSGLESAMISEQYGDQRIADFHLDDRYQAAITVVLGKWHTNSTHLKPRNPIYVVSIQEKKRSGDVNTTKPSLAGVDISGTSSTIDLSGFDLNGAICELKYLTNPAWVQDGLIVARGLRGRSEVTLEDMVKRFDDMGIASIARPKYNPLEDGTYTITIELLHNKDGK